VLSASRCVLNARCPENWPFLPMGAPAHFAVAFFALFATAWVLLDRGAADGLLAQMGRNSSRLHEQVASAGEVGRSALRGVHRLGGAQSGESPNDGYYGFSCLPILVWQVVYGAIYYCLVVQKYPHFSGHPTPQARATQSKNEVMAFLTCENSCVVNLTSAVCWAGRAAHTYDKAGLMPYWPGVFLSALFPCCTLFYMNSCTGLNEKLGGEKRGILMGAICAFFCPCCVIAQDAQSLDECTGAAVTLCGVNTRPLGTS